MAESKTIALITGANSGIGYESTKAFITASPSYHVIMACRSLAKADQAMSELQDLPTTRGTLSTIHLDVTNQASISAAASAVKEKYGRLDILVNNAGIYSKAADLETQMRETLVTNTIGPALVTEAFKPLLLASTDRKASLVYVSSGLGSITMCNDPSAPYYSIDGMPYRASKAALDMMTVCAAKQLIPKGVRVFAFDPGFVRSNLRGKTKEDYEQAEQRGAGDPAVSGQALLGIVEGKRDTENGSLVDNEGLLPW